MAKPKLKSPAGIKAGELRSTRNSTKPPKVQSVPTKPNRPRRAPLGQTSISAGRRPFLGFEVERAAYERCKPQLLQAFEGRYVAFVGEEMVGPFDHYPEAVLAGYRRFGLGPVYTRQVLAIEPSPDTIGWIEMNPCRS